MDAWKSYRIRLENAMTELTYGPSCEWALTFPSTSTKCTRWISGTTWYWLNPCLPSAFMHGCATLPQGCLVVTEACGGSHHVARQLRAQGLDARLIAAHFVTPYRMTGKSGKNDANARQRSAKPPVGPTCTLFRSRALRSKGSWWCIVYVKATSKSAMRVPIAFEACSPSSVWSSRSARRNCARC